MSGKEGSGEAEPADHEEPCDCFICRGEASEEFIQSILDAEPDGPPVSAEEFIKRLREEFGIEPDQE